MVDWNALEDEDFRARVRQFFWANYPEHLRYPAHRLRWHEIRDWYLLLSRQGWIAPGWPKEYGGMGLSPAKLIIFIEEQERHGVGRAPDQGIIMVGPLLIKHGSARQKDYYLPRILSGEHIWCQGYSEPGAGSDLAGLRTTAVLEGDHFIVNGQKTWTTLAQDATHIFLLVRTNKDAKKQEGISFLLADMATPGITVRPIDTIAGHPDFCEVFLDNVKVPKENLVGEVDKGWAIAKALLSFERLFLGSPKQCQYALGRLEQMARDIGAFADPVFVDAFTRLTLDVADLSSLYGRFADIARQGGTLGPDISIVKIWATETYARITNLMVEAAGSAGAVAGDQEIGAGAYDILNMFYHSRPPTIYGGSNEIQRNIVARNVLGLPG